ncbi:MULTISPECIES: hypothetical protein [Sinorhizobium]|uniref:hypothetical protein n=1 Tax=Sinorhizobium TaxID=28105 RepID=UPI000C7BB1DD|nr:MULTISPECIES: hypothetical protein [Sinorhizobium]MDX0106663.1 hypothetical protein [Sinorhizobium meliloti]MDX0182524.1 hypothetical protein [Sinorhizobium meliloti]MDX0408847.1 hypothetical protein [Sinorhizobium medicae]MDX0420858.1 hypothetical protein [Sinorhizobium medicae]MDX1035284.1 hypothetical protein [Sinorhizobium medicae]
MKFGLSLSLAAAGVSFLLPSDGYKAALFFICSVVVFVAMREEELDQKAAAVPLGYGANTGEEP